MTRIEHLTPEQEALLPGVRDAWLAHGLSTAPADRPAAEAGVAAAYRAAGLEPPSIVVWLGSPLAGAIGAHLLTQVEDQVGGQVGGQVRDQVEDQVGDQVRDQVRGQVRDQVWDQVGDQVWAQVEDQVEDQVGGQVRDQVEDQVRDQVRDQVYRAVYGQHEAAWLAHYDALRTIGATGVDRLDGLMLVARNAGWWWPMRGAVILTERPTTLHRDPQGRLHAEDGPALAYPDGLLDVWAWHGTRVPADLITTGWDVDRILREPNAEVRRCAVERMGWDAFVARAGLAMVGQPVDDPGNPGQVLSLFDVPEQVYDEPIRVLLCTNGSVERDGTRRRFGITVPADMPDPITAASWTYGVTPEQYTALEVRR